MKLIKILIIVLIFVGLVFDVFGYSEFQPVQILPLSSTTSVYTNQIFAYQTTVFKGYFLTCTGVPTLNYVDDGQPIETVFQTTDGLDVLYPTKPLSPGLVVKGGFKVDCKAGLVFLSPDLTFNLFNTVYYPARYIVESRGYSEQEFVYKLRELSPNLEYK